MLTEREKQACREATFLKGRGHGYGTAAEGLCPVGAVAVLRGAVPTLGGGSITSDEYTFRGLSALIAHDAQGDILAWTAQTTMRAFLDALEREGTAIFPAT